MVSTSNTYIQKIITALNAKFIKKSNTTGLVKNDGTIDTNQYLTSHQDISGKADINHNHDDRYYTENEINTALSNKQATLVSGTNIKTINNTSLLGSGNIEITTSENAGTLTELQTLIGYASFGDVIELTKDYCYNSTTDNDLWGIEIDKDITINGNGHIISGDSDAYFDSLFFITEGNFRLNDVKITNFIVSEGSISFNSEYEQTSNIVNCIFQNIGTNVISNFNSYKLNIIDCIFSHNIGGIYSNSGNTNINNCVFIENEAQCGAAFYIEAGDANINDCAFIRNHASLGGGAVVVAYYYDDNENEWKTNINNCLFSENYCNNEEQINNLLGDGGAIFSWVGNDSVSIKNSIFKNNSGTLQNEIYANEPLTIYNCEINDIANTCHNITNKPYLTESQGVNAATTSSAGIVQLEDSYSSTSTTKAPTSNALKTGLDTKADSTHTHSGYLTSHQDITGKEDKSNKVSSWSSTTTNTNYPTEKLVKDSLDGKASSTHNHDGTYLKTHQDISGKADKTGWTASKNIVTNSSGALTTEDKPTLSNLGGTVTVEKQTTAESGYAATYVVKQNNTQVGNKINIPKDFLVKSAELKTSTASNSPETGFSSGDKYIDFVINTTDGIGTDSHIYLNVKDLVDTYTADETTLTLSNNNQFSIKSVPSHTHNYLTSSDISGKIDTAGTGLSKSGTTLNHSNSINARTTAALKKYKYDAQGHITEESDISASDLPSASTSGAGVVQLEDSYSSTSTTKAPTSNALKTGLATKAGSRHTHYVNELYSEMFGQLFTDYYYDEAWTDSPSMISVLDHFAYNLDDNKVGIIDWGNEEFKQIATLSDISNKENTSNKVTSINSSSTDTQYPSAKLLYDQLATKTTPTDVDNQIEDYLSEIQSQASDYNYIIDLIYPVGSIYMSVNSSSPAVLFGGTWEQLENRFLLGAGSSYTAGTTDGEATHTLSSDEMPSHTHTQNAHTHTQNQHTHTQNAHHHSPTTSGWKWLSSKDNIQMSSARKMSYTSGSYYYPYSTSNTETIAENDKTNDVTATNQNTTATNQNTTATNQNTGGGQAHNNMPPYLVVYMWKRTG